MRVLAGELGATKTALAVYELCEDGGFEIRSEASYIGGERGSFAEALARFDAPRVDAAAFAVPGPVVDGRCNADSSLSERELSEGLGAPVKLIDDLRAVALAAPSLTESQLHVLQAAPRVPHGPVAVIGASEGLTEALCVPTESGLCVVAGEGGHASFAPSTPLELRLLQFLLRRYEHVSVERVVSGIGLREIYAFVVTEGLAPAQPDTLRRCEQESAGAVLVAQAGVDPAAEIALSLFVGAFGAEAGNWALKTLPTGGLFVAGEIAPRLISRLSAGSFMQSFLAKGRLSSRLVTLPVAVVLHPDVGLLGARVQAALLCSAGANGRKGAA